ncbi:hypothetical protein HanXRQr2_Chr01g0000631 [Helianthus annuus]|uniref:Uncharacterized protein n=1 Tax=Helianthus annuus TaxID=4232 RepID=A0A9K3JSB2_HELAN|nr:hypothetical protein HanXRQr2_Chr01g0000631 [Helianthus annuus]KAJ0955224.1 hypothetical protein HanPSC8_Chr01g0000451 [Helianthus annuus]
MASSRREDMVEEVKCVRKRQRSKRRQKGNIVICWWHRPLVLRLYKLTTIQKK